MHVVPRAAAASFTVLLHLWIALGLLHVTDGGEKPTPPLGAYGIPIDRLYAAGERIVGVDIVAPGPTNSDLACPGSRYVGVGVTTETRTERIILVGDDTPASRAGLRHDDIVLNPEVWEQPLRAGMVLQVRVLREEGQVVIPVRVGTICIG